MSFSNRQFVTVFGDYSSPKGRLTDWSTTDAENGKGNYSCLKWRQFVANFGDVSPFLATVVAVIVAKNGVVDEAEVFENFE